MPKTETERIAAARKYNLIPEDYEVHDESTGFGDYPKLPPVGMDARDPYEDLDYHYYRRNYGETVRRSLYCSDALRSLTLSPASWTAARGRRVLHG